MNESLRYLAIALLVFVSAFFSATEIAFASVNPARLKARRQKKDSLSLSLAIKIVDDYENMLGAVLVGNNLANIAASSIATLIVIDLLGDGYAWVATLVMTLLVLTFGEVIPKVLAKQFSEQFTVAVAIPIYTLSVLLKPITVVMMAFIRLLSKLWESSVADSDAVSEDDLENIIDIVEDEGVLDEEQCDLLQNALDFDSVLAYEVVTPRVDMDALDIRDPIEVNLRKIGESTYSRLPVFEDTPDNIIGILHLNRFYKEYVNNQDISIRELLLPATFVHMTMPLSDVLDKMREKKSHMVIVLDEYGGTMGLLTMEDVLEQLVGEIWDESDEIDREFVCIDNTHFEVSGDMRIDDFFDEFDIDIDEEDEEIDNTTVGGWTVSMLDGEPEKGAEFKYENLIITVLETDGRRVDRIAVEELPDTDRKIVN